MMYTLYTIDEGGEQMPKRPLRPCSHPGCPNLTWNQDRQPFGYAGVRRLFEDLDQTMTEQEGRP